MSSNSLAKEPARGLSASLKRLKAFLNQVLFNLDSPWGRRFNLTIIAMITLSALASMAGTMPGLDENWKAWIHQIEIWTSWAFAVEFVLRLLVAHRPAAYLFSVYGFIDLVAVLPLLIFGVPHFELRLLRIVRLLKLLRYLKALRMFLSNLRDSMELLLMVVGSICLAAILAGNIVHMIEPETFTDAFSGAWWSIVTMSTVGYGDLVPISIGGRILAIILMGMGISLFAIVTATLSAKVSKLMNEQRTCRSCWNKTHNNHYYCPRCGEKLD
jgi:voltage-gated potassium channel